MTDAEVRGRGVQAFGQRPPTGLARSQNVANGIAWEAIIDDWRGDVSKEAIAEAVRLAREALLT